MPAQTYDFKLVSPFLKRRKKKKMRVWTNPGPAEIILEITRLSTENPLINLAS